MLPDRAPVAQEVRIYWNENRIPFIEAHSLNDLAVAQGVVHVHLRGAQLQLLRVVALGRLAKSFGPFAADIDHTIRIFQFGKNARAIASNMPPRTRQYVDHYLEGMNFAISAQNEAGMQWPTLKAAGIENEPWTMEELIAVWRLLATDVNWIRMYQAFTSEERPERAWAKSIEDARMQDAYDGGKRALANLFLSLSRSGSNSLALDGSRTKNGKPIIASDPHVGLTLPSLWFIVGLRAPGIEAVGLTIPGLPVIALGRSRHIAWGGTNMWGLSTALIGLDANDLAHAEKGEETIEIAGWPDRTIEIRNTEWGPVLSDSPLFASETDFAISWVGHSTGDEITTYLKILAASDCDEFRQAFSTWSVSAQNYLCADTAGNIQHILAYRKPNPGAEVEDLIRDKRDAFQSFTLPTELPFRKNPGEGYLSSANDAPTWADVPIGFFFSPGFRIDRMSELLAGQSQMGVEELRKLQLDPCSIAARQGRDALLRRLGEEATDAQAGKAARILAHWDGCYTQGSAGAQFYESVMASMRQELSLPPASGEQWQEVLAQWQKSNLNLGDLMEELASEEMTGWALKTVIQNPLGFLPGIGSAWRIQELAENGGSQTIYKRGFVFEDGAARVTYGADARHISDLSDPDANFFLLFGGEDGYMQSPTTTDQIERWRENRLIQVPLNADSIRSWKLTLLRPLTNASSPP